MDLNRLTQKDMHDGKDRARSVQWSAPLVWRPGQKPSDEDIIITRFAKFYSSSYLRSTWGLRLGYFFFKNF